MSEQLAQLEKNGGGSSYTFIGTVTGATPITVDKEELLIVLTYGGTTDKCINHFNTLVGSGNYLIVGGYLGSVNGAYGKFNYDSVNKTISLLYAYINSQNVLATSQLDVYGK